MFDPIHKQILRSTYMVIIITEIIMIHSRAGILSHVSRNAELANITYLTRAPLGKRSQLLRQDLILNRVLMFDKYEKNRQTVMFCRKGGAVESASLGDGGQITADRQPPINVLHHCHLTLITISSFHNYTKWKETHHMTRFQYFFYNHHSFTQHKTPFHSWHKTKEH